MVVLAFCTAFGASGQTVRPLEQPAAVRAGPMGLAGAATMGLGVGLLAAGAALFAVQENPELRDDIRPYAQAITGVVATLTAATLVALGAAMLSADLLWLSAEEDSSQAVDEEPSPASSTAPATETLASGVRGRSALRSRAAP